MELVTSVMVCLVILKSLLLFQVESERIYNYLLSCETYWLVAREKRSQKVIIIIVYNIKVS